MREPYGLAEQGRSAPRSQIALLPQTTSPLDEVWVALDVETTGLSPDSDEIIEVGAIKFQGGRTIDTFQSFVNPQRTLSRFISGYTGITQKDVSDAPPFSRVARDLTPFIGTAPIVGHNLAFDLGFLNSKGLRLPNPMCDTWDLAFVLLPEYKEYQLAKLAASFGITHPGAHRAIPDAQVTRDLFLKLAEAASDLDVYTLAEMERLASRSSWVLSYFLRGLETSKVIASSYTTSPDGGREVGPIQQQPPPSSVGAAGIDIKALRERLRRPKALRPNPALEKIDVDGVASLLEEGGPVSTTMPGFEERPEQIAMARAVAVAINEQRRLMVEAGTGVGKSLAYLLPAALYALKNNKRVVVSTNTINLQEQLLNKDVPAVVKTIEATEPELAEKLRYTQLKGRANYLCLNRWAHLRGSDSLSDDEARLLSKALVWLRSTETGDRSELNLGRRRAAAPWDRLSAQGAWDCTGMSGVCFLRAAREKAAAAHLVIVNHALLMSDLIAGRALIPDHDILIVDEAHHLEEEATRHLGFELAQSSLDDHLQSMGGESGLLNRAVMAFRGSSAAESRRGTTEEMVARIAGLVPAVRDRVAGMFTLVSAFLDRPDDGLRITAATRGQPAWSDLEVQWENVDVSLAELEREVTALSTSLEDLEEAGLLDYDSLLLETANVLQRNAELRQRLAEFIPSPKPDGIYWVSRSSRSGDLTLHSAPLHVGAQLDELLYSQKQSVILTGATLSAGGSFDHIRQRTGFEETGELLLGSPFDYPRAALLCVPNDMPEPTLSTYQSAVERAVTDATVAAGGRTMALFTSHASLQATSAGIREDLQAQGFDVLAQGIDGTPHQLLRRFVENPRSALLGTSSFWEGVDLAGDTLKVLLVARLPFAVPTEPVFTARSELYEDSFSEYAVPQAILRLRQGFGRLIRTKADRGVAIILDRRIVSRRYGKSFLDSLPPVTVKTCNLQQLSHEIRGWLEV